MQWSEGGLPTSIEFSASITVPTALGAPRFAQRTAVTIPYTVAIATIAIKAARMTGGMDATPIADVYDKASWRCANRISRAKLD